MIREAIHASGVWLYQGKALEALRSMPDGRLDAVVTDPPYGLANTSAADVADALWAWTVDDDGRDREWAPSGRGFMGHEWDGFVPPPAVWDECFRVLKPGGHLLVFAGSRTADLMGISVRLAGFEIRDTITWHYAQGFPKSLDVGKAIDKAAPATEDAKRWDGFGTALKPASEPIIVARKPLEGTVAANVLAHGTGALNIDGCRVPTDEPLGRPYGGGNEVYGKYSMPNGTRTGDNLTGRWPSNVVFSHAPDCGPTDATPCVEGCPVRELAEQSGTRTSGSRKAGTYAGPAADSSAYGEYGAAAAAEIVGSTGTAARFFPTFRFEPKAPTRERPKVDGVSHPTVKPLELMRWLVRLVTPPGGMVLDPFAGSGTTGEAAVLEGVRAVLVEREPDYWPLIRERMNRP